jgi:hypothetical protein
VVMGKKGSQTIVKGMVAVAVVVVTTIPLVGDLLAMKEVPVTDLGLMIAPVVVVTPLMMSEIERIRRDDTYLLQLIFQQHGWSCITCV